MSPGAATDGVAPFFPHRSLKSDDLYVAIVSSPLPPSPLSNVVCPVFSINSAAKNLISFPLDGVTQGGPPPSDATASSRVYLGAWPPTAIFYWKLRWLFTMHMHVLIIIIIIIIINRHFRNAQLTTNRHIGVRGDAEPSLTLIQVRFQ